VLTHGTRPDDLVCVSFRKCHIFAVLSNKRKQHPFTAQLLDRLLARCRFFSMRLRYRILCPPLRFPRLRRRQRLQLLPPIHSSARSKMKRQMTGNDDDVFSARVVLPRMKTHTSSIDAPILQFLDVPSPARCNSPHPLTLPIRTTAPPLSLSGSSYSSSFD
jgi:hypothetical protein